MQKRIINILLIFGFGLLFSSCDDFLTSKDKDKVIPKYAVHFEELIYGEMINILDDWQSATDAMADYVGMEAVVGGSSKPQISIYGYYIWSQSPEYDIENDFNDDQIFPSLYKDVLLCNSIESLLPAVTDDLKLVDRLYGEIYFLRAHRNYLLAELYGYPYVDEQSSHTTPCVPLNTLTGVENVQLGRASQRVVYDKIQTDIELAISHFTSAGYPETIYRPGLRAARVLATRIYMTQKRYDDVIRHANALESEFTKLYSLDALYALNGNEQIEDISGLAEKTPFFNRRNTEILFTYGTYNTQPYHASWTVTPTHHLTTYDVVALYEPDDLRSKIFFDRWSQPAKWRSTDQTAFGNSLRLSEALFNRAEALLAQGDRDGAERDIQRIRDARFVGNKAPALDFGATPLEVLKVERMREFCFEGMRWSDLRRWGCPEITHRYIDPQNRAYDYVLAKGDKAYTLPVPRKELERNRVIENVDRPVRSGTPVTNN